MKNFRNPQIFSAALFLLLIGASFAAFGRSLFQGFAPIDDAFLIAGNLAIRGITFDHLKTIFTTYDPELYIPLTFLTFQINYVINGLHPFGFHLVNIVLHGMNAFLVFIILRKITREQALSAFAALLFAVHPLQTEAVVWITARKDLLSAFFSFLSIIAYLRYRNLDEGNKEIGQKSNWNNVRLALLPSPVRRSSRRSEVGCLLALSLFFFLLALLSKVTAATLPVALIIIDALSFDAKRRTGIFLSYVSRALSEKWPYFILSILFVGISIGGKTRIVAASNSPLELALLFAKSTLFSLQKFFIPTGLSPLYEISGKVSFVNPAFFLPFLVFFVLLAFLYPAKFPQERSGVAFLYRRVQWPLLTAALFLTLLSPTILTFHKIDTIFLTSDRYMYLPLLAILLFLIFAITQLRDSWNKLLLPRAIPATARGLVIAILTMLSIRQTGFWQNSETLFAHAKDVTPQSVAVSTAIARDLLAKNRPEEAFALLKDRLKEGDDSRLHIAAGQVYAATGQVPDALEQFSIAAKINPQDSEALFSMGSVEEQTGATDSAITHYRTAIALDPSYIAAHDGLGRILFAKGDLSGAEEQFRTSLKWNWNDASAHLGLMKILARQQKFDEAEIHRVAAMEIGT
ncbi:MAG: tetratricopeptide repeat protein [Candidatus Peregrinibacteria bacterium]